ncbi:hypothetical protein N9X24_03490 [Rickettsiales bacterium]|nr:hypothetical protein [Rickettsiales bacterium]
MTIKLKQKTAHFVAGHPLRIGGDLGHHKAGSDVNKDEVFTFEFEGKPFYVKNIIGEGKGTQEEGSYRGLLKSGYSFSAHQEAWNKIQKEFLEKRLEVLTAQGVGEEEARNFIGKATCGFYAGKAIGGESSDIDKMYKDFNKLFKDDVSKKNNALDEFQKLQDYIEIPGIEGLTFVHLYSHVANPVQAGLEKPPTAKTKKHFTGLFYKKIIESDFSKAIGDTIKSAIEKLTTDGYAIIHSTTPGIGVFKNPDFGRLGGKIWGDVKFRAIENIQQQDEGEYKAEDILTNAIIEKANFTDTFKRANNITGLVANAGVTKGLSEKINNFYTAETILKNQEDTLFVFGGNAEHTMNRGAAGDGQALATVGNDNIFPIITKKDISFDNLEYYKKETKAILIEFVKNGGKVVFPLTDDGKKVNVGTNLAPNPEMQKWATDLYQELQEITVINDSPKEAMSKYHKDMNALEKKMEGRVAGAPDADAEEERRREETERREEERRRAEAERKAREERSGEGSVAIQPLTEKDIKDVASFMEWNKEAYGKLNENSLPKDIESFLNPKINNTEVFAGWGGKLKQEGGVDSNIFNINNVIDGGFAAAIGLKEGNKITIDLTDKDFKGKTGQLLEAALINKLRTGNLDGIESIGEYNLRNREHKQFLESYKGNKRLFVGGKLQGESVVIEGGRSPAPVERADDKELEALISTYLLDKTDVTREKLERGLGVSTGGRENHLGSKSVTNLVTRYTKERVETGGVDYKALGISAAQLDVNILEKDNKRAVIIADGVFFHCVCQDKGDENWVTKSSDITNSSAHKQVIEDAFVNRADGAADHTGFIEHDGTCGIGAAIMAIDFLNETKSVANRSSGQTHHDVWQDVLKVAKAPSTAPSVPAAASGLRGVPRRF